MKIIPILVAATTILMSTGCGTFLGRGQQNVADIKQGVYPATRTDGTIFWLCITGNSVFQTHSSGWVAPLAGYTLVPFCFLIDLPISLVTDTVMLPIDIRKSKERQPADIPDNPGERRRQERLTLEDRRRLREEYLQKQQNESTRRPNLSPLA
jgi:uncharacterized protein YceK